MEHYGQVTAGATLQIPFTTNAATGAAVAPSSAFEAADVRIYKDGSATQRSSESGYTMTSPFDSVTGLHLLSVDLADNTDAGFYAAGSRYFVVLVPDETVDSVAVVRVLADFTIGPVAANVTQFGGNAGTFASGRPEVNTTLIEGADATNQIRDAVVDDATRIDASALNTASVTTIPAILTDTAEIGAAGAGLTALASAAALTTVDSNVDAVKAVTDLLPNGGALSSLATAAALTTVDTVVDAVKAVTDALPDAGALTSLAQAAALTTVDTVVDAIKAKTDALPSDPADQSLIIAATNAIAALIGTPSVTVSADIATRASAANLTTVDTVVDAIKVVTDALVAAQTEPSGVPADNETPLDKLAYVFMMLRNRLDVTATKKTFYDKDGNAEWEQDLSDNDTTYSQSAANGV